MGNWVERKCVLCKFTTRKRKHIKCPNCGGELTELTTQPTKLNSIPDNHAISSCITMDFLLWMVKQY